MWWFIVAYLAFMILMWAILTAGSRADDDMGYD
jgi:hypothetical protein